MSKPTFRLANGDERNTLDLLVSDSPERVSEVDIGNPLGLGQQGHMSITFRLNLNHRITRQFCSRRYNYKSANILGLNEAFANVDWPAISGKSVQECYNNIPSCYDKLCDEFIPKKPARPRTRRHPWSSEELFKLVKIKKSLFYANHSAKGKNAKLAKEYREARIAVSKCSKQVIKAYEHKLAEDKYQPKRLFSYVNRLKPIARGISEMKDRFGVVHTDKNKIANILNEHYKSVFICESPDSVQLFFKSRTESRLSTMAFNIEDVKKQY